MSPGSGMPVAVPAARPPAVESSRATPRHAAEPSRQDAGFAAALDSAVADTTTATDPPSEHDDIVPTVDGSQAGVLVPPVATIPAATIPTATMAPDPMSTAPAPTAPTLTAAPVTAPMVTAPAVTAPAVTAAPVTAPTVTAQVDQPPTTREPAPAQPIPAQPAPAQPGAADRLVATVIRVPQPAPNVATDRVVTAQPAADQPAGTLPVTPMPTSPTGPTAPPPAEAGPALGTAQLPSVTASEGRGNTTTEGLTEAAESIAATPAASQQPAPATATPSPGPTPTPSAVTTPAGPFTLASLPELPGLLAAVVVDRQSHEILVQFTPEELGPVQLRATLSEGHLSVELAGGGDVARDAMRASLADLTGSLLRAGIDATVTVSDTSFGAPDSDRSPAHSRDGSGGDRHPTAHDPSPEPPPMRVTTRWTADESSAPGARLDVRV